MKQKRWVSYLFSANERADRVFLRCVCILVPIVVLWTLFTSIFHETVARIYPGCPIFRLTGLYCPGCGGTHALRALAHGQVADSLRLHPLALPAVAFTAVFLVTLLLNKLSNGRTPKPHFRRIYLVILIALLLYHVIAANVGGELIW